MSDSHKYEWPGHTQTLVVTGLDAYYNEVQEEITVPIHVGHSRVGYWWRKRFQHLMDVIRSRLALNQA